MWRTQTPLHPSRAPSCRESSVSRRALSLEASAQSLRVSGAIRLLESVRRTAVGHAAREPAAARTTIGATRGGRRGTQASRFQSQDAEAERSCACLASKGVGFESPMLHPSSRTLKLAVSASEFHADCSAGRRVQLPACSHLFPEINVHLIASAPTGYYLEHMPWGEPLLNERLELVDGAIKVPRRSDLVSAWMSRSSAATSPTSIRGFPQGASDR